MSESNRSDGLNEESTNECGERRQAQEWTLENQVRLLSFVQQAPCLYNRESPAFRDKIIKQDAWNLIGKNLNITGDEALKRFTYLREKYGRYLRFRRTGKLVKLFQDGFPVAPHMEFLKSHIIERQRRQADEFEQILGSEQSYDEFSFNGAEAQSLGSVSADTNGTHSKPRKRESDTIDNDSASEEIDSDVQIVDSRSLRPTQKDHKLRSSKPTRNKLSKFENESILNEKLREILERGTAGHETSPNYLFGMYVTSKLDKMSPLDAASCTFRIHEILFQTEVSKFNNPPANPLESLTFNNGVSNSIYK